MRENAVLAVPPRELVKLALDHKHLTVKARTVNQQLYHQWCMDQFYWYVDEDTFIGYQWPVALVAIKPERVRQGAEPGLGLRLYPRRRADARAVFHPGLR